MSIPFILFFFSTNKIMNKKIHPVPSIQLNSHQNLYRIDCNRFKIRQHFSIHCDPFYQFKNYLFFYSIITFEFLYYYHINLMNSLINYKLHHIGAGRGLSVKRVNCLKSIRQKMSCYVNSISISFDKTRIKESNT